MKTHLLLVMFALGLILVLGLAFGAADGRPAAAINDARAPLAAAGGWFCEPFSTDVFASGAWTRSDPFCVSVDATAGWLHFRPDEECYEETATTAVTLTLPLVVETRLRLVSGGDDFRLPWLSLNDDAVRVCYLPWSGYGWFFGSDWTKIHTKAPPAKNVWMTVLAIIRADGGELWARYDTDPAFTFVAARSWSLASPITQIRYRQPGYSRYAAVCDVDYLVAAHGAAPYAVAGRVRDASGYPLSGVTVAASASVSATTDATGWYILTDLPTGTHTIIPTRGHWTFAPVTRTVAVPPLAASQDFTATLTDPLCVYLPLVLRTPALTGLEVTQAIQSLGASADLIAGRPALVRAYVNLSGSYDARLYGARGGVPLPGSPLLADNGPITQPAGSQREVLTSTLNFTLPSDWRTGVVDLYAELTAPDGSVTYSRYPPAGSQSFVFQNVSPLEVVIVPVAYHYGGQVYRPITNYVSLASWTYHVYPLAQPPTVYPHAEYHYYNDLSVGANFSDLLKQITAIRDSERPGSSVHYYGLIPYNYGVYSLAVAGLAWMPRPDLGADHIRKSLAAVGYDRQDNEYGAKTMTHEMGHNLTRMHAPCGNPADVDPNYPFPDGRIGEYGYDIVTSVLWPPTTADYMSYCYPKWTSEYTYEGIRAIRQLIAPALASRTEAAAPQPVFQVSGWIRPADDQGRLNPAVRLIAPVSAPGSGAYSLELTDAAGRGLYRHAFEPVAIADAAGDDRLGFAGNLPAAPGTAAIRLWHGARLLAELRPGSQAPTLHQAVWSRHQTGGGGATLTLDWQATDPDGDPLTYAVRYSFDGGSTWQTVAQGLTNPALDLDPAFLPGGPGLLQVLASDGLHTAQVTLEPIRLPDKAPQVGLIAPLAGQSFRRGRPLTLVGLGWDLEDGALPDGAYRWESDRDGVLGVGRVLDLDRGLSAGRHVLTLTVRDSAGQVARQSVAITVE